MNSSPSAKRPPRVLRGMEHAEMSLAPIITPRAHIPVAATASAATIEQQLEAARREGFEAGRLAALEDATVRADETRAGAAKRAAEHLVELAAAFARDRERIVEEVVSDYVDLGFELVRTILGDELALRDDATRQAVTRALRLAPPDEDLVIRVHPASELVAEDLAELTSGAKISLRLDASIEHGGCIVEAGACRIDAQASAALARVRSEFDKLRTTTTSVA